MTDPYIEATDRFVAAVDRLKTELGKDAVAIEKRLATLETIPRSIDQLRNEFREFAKEAVTKDELDNAIALALSRHQTEELREERLKPKGETRVMSMRLKSDKLKFWAAVIGSVVILLSGAFSAYAAMQVAKISSAREPKL